METTYHKTLRSLFQSLSQRWRPEDVADKILILLAGKLSPKEKGILERAAKGSLKRSFWGYTSMLQTFAKPIGAEKQIKKAIELFRLEENTFNTYDNPKTIETFIRQTSGMIGKEYGQSNFLAHRLSKLQRRASGFDWSKRQYNKRFRLLQRMEKKLNTLIREQQKSEFAQMAKHGLAHHLTWEEFSGDENTACFIAYFTARCNLRSEFTIFGQQRAYDEIADMLFSRCSGIPKKDKYWWRVFQTVGLVDARSSNTTGWLAIAQVYPNPKVLAMLTDEQKGILLGRWTSMLEDIAGMLKQIWENSNINCTTMVVKRGNDSSTWNSTAGAWNNARDNWINLVYSLGQEAILEQMCFGKVLRLMAADIVAWHFRAGGKLDPNTIVWNVLPLPWQVFSGEAVCTKAMVEEACRKAELDPNKSGWIAPRPHGVEIFRPTPELVRGVSISNPFLAKVLKQHHYFSGKPNVKVIYPEKN